HGAYHAWRRKTLTMRWYLEPPNPDTDQKRAMSRCVQIGRRVSQNLTRAVFQAGTRALTSKYRRPCSKNKLAVNSLPEGRAYPIGAVGEVNSRRATESLRSAS